LFTEQIELGQKKKQQTGNKLPLVIIQILGDRVIGCILHE